MERPNLDCAYRIERSSLGHLALIMANLASVGWRDLALIIQMGQKDLGLTIHTGETSMFTDSSDTERSSLNFLPA